ncbi:Asp23/Gls24 family envelope stress response protein [Peptostreptococcus canis]|uniref:Asp23/Gls24 family envelope stress response protein n=1 Tax=Peptostreptococcus canis TaxID=1159213 RepID=A0ABR6TJR0_9FIRM|nr:Asp23/Gls24 family envelope stress response protein [Peptostreptococcus canis]MBC2575655.1 Asp23/Gls24 family envelope stress response protein [Peptostreptococcus canis]MBP1997140.1 putative alkaline shock family protein YloU [Peptostreptococcus canis]
MSSVLNNKLGKIEIDKHVLAQLTYKAAMESYGLVGFSSKSKGIVELLKGENATKGVNILELGEDLVDIEIFVILQYGTNITTVANNIIERIKYTVETYSGIKINQITVSVQGIRVK